MRADRQRHRESLSHNIKEHYSLRTLRLLVLLLAAANLINIGADIGALGASAGLIIHIPVSGLMVVFTLSPRSAPPPTRPGRSSRWSGPSHIRGRSPRGLFALGIVSLGMLAIPVLAGSTSYALSEAREKKEGMDLKPREGRTGVCR